MARSIELLLGTPWLNELPKLLVMTEPIVVLLEMLWLGSVLLVTPWLDGLAKLLVIVGLV